MEAWSRCSPAEQVTTDSCDISSQRVDKILFYSILDIKIRRWEGVREWGNRWMLASPGPWRLGVAVPLRSRSPQTAAELARSGSIRFYSKILFYSTLN